MGQHSSIEWTHHTFNPWWGCIKVSPACKHCYAEAWANRFGMDLWGGRNPRRFFGDAHWREPLRWNREAATARERKRVFCASMGDVFEPRRELDAARERLWKLIEETPALDWLLLTKRPDKIAGAVPWLGKWPSNIWLGTTAENQLWAERRVPILLQYDVAVRFVSCEPLLGPLDIEKWLSGARKKPGIDWVIVGGESGRQARPMHPSWAASLKQQCTASHVAFHFKQWGNWAPVLGELTSKSARQVTLSDASGVASFQRLPKHEAGRVLDGREWDELPIPRRHPLKAAE